MFDNIKFEFGKPTKKVKLNQTPMKESKFGDLVMNNEKTTTNTSFSLDNEKEGYLKVSCFLDEEEVQSDHNEEERDVMREGSQRPLIMPKLSRRITKDCSRGYEFGDLPLLKSNSMMEERRKEEETTRLGDNVYVSKGQNALSNKRMFYQLSNSDLSRFQSDYEVERVQRTANVLRYKCMHKLERIYYYVKEIRFKQVSDDGLFQFMKHYTLDQIKIYNKDKNNNFIRFFNSWNEKDSIFMCFEYASRSLDDLINDGIRLKEKQVWDIIQNCSSALHWLESEHQLYHCNIRPGNILKCTKKYKLTDLFGSKDNFSHFLKDETYLAKNRVYIAPEIRNYNLYLKGIDFAQSDIYSLGICLIENLMDSNILYEQSSRIKYSIKKHLFGYSPTLCRTLLNMINQDPYARPRAEALMNLSFENSQSKKHARKRHSI